MAENGTERDIRNNAGKRKNELGLYRCPFCGSDKAKISQDKNGWNGYMVECDWCGCTTKKCDYVVDAVEAWNKRPEDYV
jgi:Lar family restriction alleviation protein